MENGKYLVDFFLGANTPQGFVSRFDQLADPAEGWRKFIIKGGPGTGKSGMMKRLAAELSSRTNRLELIHCSSDVGSLDAVIAADLKASIADGTAPHGVGAIAPTPWGVRLRAGYAPGHLLLPLRGNSPCPLRSNEVRTYGSPSHSLWNGAPS